MCKRQNKEQVNNCHCEGCHFLHSFPYPLSQSNAGLFMSKSAVAVVSRVLSSEDFPGLDCFYTAFDLHCLLLLPRKPSCLQKSGWRPSNPDHPFMGWNGRHRITWKDSELVTCPTRGRGPSVSFRSQGSWEPFLFKLRLAASEKHLEGLFVLSFLQ